MAPDDWTLPVVVCLRIAKDRSIVKCHSSVRFAPAMICRAFLVAEVYGLPLQGPNLAVFVGDQARLRLGQETRLNCASWLLVFAAEIPHAVEVLCPIEWCSSHGC